MALPSLALLGGLSPAGGGERLSSMAGPQYPVTRVDAVVDTLHGQPVADPYRWLEEGEAEPVRRWTAAQNALTESILAPLAIRQSLARDLEAVMAVGSVGVPVPRGERLFIERRAAGQKQGVLYVQDGPRAKQRPLVDVNPLSEEGLVSLDWFAPSPDGSLLAYGLSEGGSEISTLYLVETATGRRLDEAIPRTRHAAVAWEGDGRAFYYCRYPAPGEVPADEESYHRSVYRHRVGEDWRNDERIYRDAIKEAWPQASVSPDGRWLLVHSWIGHRQTRAFLRDLRDPAGDWRVVVDGPEVNVQAAVAGDRLFLHTDHGAPNFRVMSAALDAPEMESWRELVPESEDALTEIFLAGGQLWLHYLHRATSLVRRHSPEGEFLGELTLPGLGSWEAPEGEWESERCFYHYQSYFHPRTIFSHDIAADESRFHSCSVDDFDASPYTMEQVWYESRDGTPISMFVVHRRDLELNGDNPTVLAGYGGFQVNETPYFSLARTLLLERGFVIARPNLRGGGEYGESWHEAGMLDRKQNTFDDFIAAAEYLIAKGYTRPERLAIEGGSNGGLLVGAVLVQRPELCRAAVCAVPLLDMLRYHRFLIGRLWIPEYGSAEDPEQFAWLWAYSPYHHVGAGADYPALLLTAAEGDSRVDPLHARKMAAAMQAADTSADSPVLLRIESKAGHGLGKPTTMIIDSIADEWGFLCWQLGVE